jgi:hypothetical protein
MGERLSSRDRDFIDGETWVGATGLLQAARWTFGHCRRGRAQSSFGEWTKENRDSDASEQENKEMDVSREFWSCNRESESMKGKGRSD